MNIAAMNIRIMFQKNAVAADSIGNRTNAWTDYFSCYATASGQSGEETEEAGMTVVEERMNFTVRYCPETAAIVPDRFRIVFGERIYNILSVDDMAFRKNSLKFRAERVRR